MEWEWVLTSLQGAVGRPPSGTHPGLVATAQRGRVPSGTGCGGVLSALVPLELLAGGRFCPGPDQRPRGRSGHIPGFGSCCSCGLFLCFCRTTTGPGPRGPPQAHQLARALHVFNKRHGGLSWVAGEGSGPEGPMWAALTVSPKGLGVWRSPRQRGGYRRALLHPCPQTCMHTHVYAHTYLNKHMCAHTRVRAHVHSRTRSKADMHTCIHTCVHRHIWTRVFTHTHVQGTHVRACANRHPWCSLGSLALCTGPGPRACSGSAVTALKFLRTCEQGSLPAPPFPSAAPPPPAPVQ